MPKGVGWDASFHWRVDEPTANLLSRSYPMRMQRMVVHGGKFTVNRAPHGLFDQQKLF